MNTPAVFPIEPGFVWLKHIGPKHQPWNDAAELSEGLIERVATVHLDSDSYEIIFSHANGWSTGGNGGTKWAEHFPGERVDHFDFWGIPNSVEPVLRACLIELIRRGYAVPPCKREVELMHIELTPKIVVDARQQ